MTESFGLEYTDALYGYTLMLTRNRVEAEDLVQETYVRALQARHRLPGENSPVAQDTRRFHIGGPFVYRDCFVSEIYSQTCFVESSATCL
jgi:hypothetical protein